MPAIPAILTILLEHPEGVEESSLIVAAGEMQSLESALEVLLGHDIIIRHSGRVFLTRGAKTHDTVRRILEAFHDIRSFTETAFLVRGILNATEYYQCLVHKKTMFAMLTKEDVPIGMLEKVIAVEESQGYVENIDISYRLKGHIREKFFPFIPHHHYDDFVLMHSRIASADTAIIEERYILAHHPASIAEQARQYTAEHKPHILGTVRNQAFDIIWWYDRY